MEAGAELPVMPSLGLALIVKNEETSLPVLLASIEGAFDQIVLVDTGSTDRTKQVFREWAITQSCTVILDDFEWVEDFAAARAHADKLLQTDWYCWADADDTIQGAQNLRSVCAQAPPEVSAFIADYHYAHDQHGNVVCTLPRERLVRAGRGTWLGRVHEAQSVQGASIILDPQIARWVHQKTPMVESSNDRNLRILQACVKDEPENSRVLGYLGTETAARGQFEESLPYYRRYLALKTGWDEERAQIHRKYAMSLMALDRDQDALETALAALAVVPDWPDSHLTLAQASYKLGAYEKAIKWAMEVLRLGHPQSMLILNPLDYKLQPHIVLAGAYGALNDIDKAIEHASQALAIVPDLPDLQRYMAGWQATTKREYVAKTWIGAAQMLVEHDEQLKALTLLDSVPYLATDHPDVVAARSQIRERLLWLHDDEAYGRHYKEGGSKPEDFHDDETALAICDQLPRVEFLERGLHELQEAA